VTVSKCGGVCYLGDILGCVLEVVETAVGEDEPPPLPVLPAAALRTEYQASDRGRHRFESDSTEESMSLQFGKVFELRNVFKKENLRYTSKLLIKQQPI
jgi:hypothetical protein